MGTNQSPFISPNSYSISFISDCFPSKFSVINEYNSEVTFSLKLYVNKQPKHDCSLHITIFKLKTLLILLKYESLMKYLYCDIMLYKLLAIKIFLEDVIVRL